jgi:hypothetical protein
MKWQKQAVRSNDSTPVFTMASHHSTNTQVLVDILAMSKCQHLLHGLLAVSEAAHYFNPSLHGRSVNLEIRNHATIPQFQLMVGKGNFKAKLANTTSPNPTQLQHLQLLCLS